SNIWLYPCTFFECGVATAMEAQVLGAIPITRPWGGLDQIVQSGRLIDGDPSRRDVQQRYVEAILETAAGVSNLWDVEFANSPGTSCRFLMMMWARGEYNWNRIVDHHVSLADNPVPPAKWRRPA